MKKNIITLCSSVSFYKELLDIAARLRQLGFRVLVPITALQMKKSGDFTVKRHKTWYQNPKDYKIKTQLMRHHFKKVIESDAILVINFKKSGYPGYIGGDTKKLPAHASLPPYCPVK